MALEELKGRDLGTQTVVIERAPVPVFARAIGEDAAAFRGDGAPVPPTYPFCWSYWGTVDGEVQGLPIAELRPRGMILHGEQEFTYHRPIVAGDVLTCEGQVVDLYSKESSSGRVMTFLVTEDVYRDQTGEPVLTSRMNLIHRA